MGRLRTYPTPRLLQYFFKFFFYELFACRADASAFAFSCHNQTQHSYRASDLLGEIPHGETRDKTCSFEFVWSCSCFFHDGNL